MLFQGKTSAPSGRPQVHEDMYTARNSDERLELAVPYTSWTWQLPLSSEVVKTDATSFLFFAAEDDGTDAT